MDDIKEQLTIDGDQIAGRAELSGGDLRAAKWDYFERTCMENLNIVLTMSITTKKGNSTLRGYCRNFPGLLGHMTTNWMTAWPKEAWTYIAKAFLGEHPKIPEQHREAVIAHSVLVHDTVQHYSMELFLMYRQVNYVTPKHFLGYIMTFLGLIDRQEARQEQRRGRLQEGVNKLDAAVHQIGQLSIMVEEHRKNVSEAAVKYDQILHRINEIEREKKVWDEQLYEKSIEVEQKTKQIGLERIVAEQILTAHFPVAWDKARAALAEITLEDCEAEIIKSTVVPEAMQTIFECILVLRGDSDTTWETAKSNITRKGEDPPGRLNLFTELQGIHL